MSRPYARWLSRNRGHWVLKTRSVPESAVVVDDGARHAETVAHKERMPLFDPNGLDKCDDIQFSPEQKRRAWALIQPA